MKVRAAISVALLLPSLPLRDADVDVGVDVEPTGRVYVMNVFNPTLFAKSLILSFKYGRELAALSPLAC